MDEHQQIVKSEQFQVVDRNGHTCMVLGTKGDRPFFELLRADGTVGVSIGLNEGQEPNVSVLDKKGRVRIEIRLYDDDGEGDGEYPSIGLMGYDGQPRAYVTATPHDYGEIGVVDANNGLVLLNEHDITEVS